MQREPIVAQSREEAKALAELICSKCTFNEFGLCMYKNTYASKYINFLDLRQLGIIHKKESFIDDNLKCCHGKYFKPINNVHR